MTIREKESAIESMIAPWPQLMELTKWKRERLLRDAKDESERGEIEFEYDSALDKIIGDLGST